MGGQREERDVDEYGGKRETGKQEKVRGRTAANAGTAK